jgi:hypothetical protein
MGGMKKHNELLPAFKEFKAHEKTQFVKKLVPPAGVYTRLPVVFVDGIQNRMHLKGQKV